MSKKSTEKYNTKKQPSKMESGQASRKKLDETIRIAQWPRKSGEVLRVALEPYGGVDLAQIRVWYLNAEGKLAPSFKGIAEPIERLPKLYRAVRKCLRTARELGLLPKRVRRRR